MGDPETPLDKFSFDAEFLDEFSDDVARDAADASTLEVLLEHNSATSSVHSYRLNSLLSTDGSTDFVASQIDWRR